MTQNTRSLTASETLLPVSLEAHYAKVKKLDEKVKSLNAQREEYIEELFKPNPQADIMEKLNSNEKELKEKEVEYAAAYSSYINRLFYDNSAERFPVTPVAQPTVAAIIPERKIVTLTPAEQQTVADQHYFIPTEINFVINGQPHKVTADMCTSDVGIGTFSFCIGQLSPQGVPLIAPFSYCEETLKVGVARHYSYFQNSYFILFQNKTKARAEITLTIDEHKPINFNFPPSQSYLMDGRPDNEDKKPENALFLAKKAKAKDALGIRPQIDTTTIMIKLEDESQLPPRSYPTSVGGGCRAATSFGGASLSMYGSDSAITCYRSVFAKFGFRLMLHKNSQAAQTYAKHNSIAKMRRTSSDSRNIEIINLRNHLFKQARDANDSSTTTIPANEAQKTVSLKS